MQVMITAYYFENTDIIRRRRRGLFGVVFGGFRHEGFVIPAPIEDIEDKNSLFFFINKESRNSFLVYGRNPQV